MQAILVKYLSPTNNKAGRLKASCTAGSIIIGYPHEQGGDAHKFAAEALCTKLGCLPPAYPKLAGVELPDDSEVFVFLPKNKE